MQTPNLIELIEALFLETNNLDISKLLFYYEQLVDSSERLNVARMLKNAHERKFIFDKYPSFRSVKISILSNFTTTFLDDYLYIYCIQNGIKPEIQSVDYQYVQNLLDPGSEYYKFQADITLLLLDEHIITDELPMVWGIQEISKLMKEKKNQLKQLIDQNRRNSKGFLVINTIPISKLTLAEIIDYETKTKIKIEWAKFNLFIQEIPIHEENVIEIDINTLLQSEKVKQLRDERLSGYALMHMDSTLLDQIAHEFSLVVNAAFGKIYKCLTVDLDETLWGGIVGDDGIQNVKLGHFDEGQAFCKFQRSIKQLNSQGVLLAINSKNDLDIVKEIFNQHDDMVLRWGDFVSTQVNWQAKHENIKRISEQLNINQDSIVFIDDNPVECGLVAEKLPEVSTICLGNDVYKFKEILLLKGLFNKFRITDEDLKRSKLYQEDVERTNFLGMCDSNADYLLKLDLRMKVELLNSQNIARASQLSTRTNQFNMTGIRYSEMDLNNILLEKNQSIWVITTSDKFGNNGIVGLVSFRKNFANKEMIIDNFILSCRVFSRGIEENMLSESIKYAQWLGFETISAEYIKTDRNTKIQDFYLKNGFDLTQESEPKYSYRHNLEKSIIPPSWVKLEQYCFGENDANC